MLIALGHWSEFLNCPSIVIMCRETACEHFILSAMAVKLKNVCVAVKLKDVCAKKPKSL